MIVFQQYLQNVVLDLWENGILGRSLAMIHILEFQKRGLPHAHLVLTFEQDDRLRDAADVDSIISAKIPSHQQFPLLHETILNQMMHSPCDQDNPNCPCMVNNRCSKNFPIPFSTRSTSVCGHIHSINMDKMVALYRNRYLVEVWLL